MKKKPIRDWKANRAWADQRTHCQLCQKLPYWPGLSVHHIVKFGRSDEPTNFLLLCHRCHELAEGLNCSKEMPKFRLGHALALKALVDPDEFDLERLGDLYGRTLPEFDYRHPLLRRLISDSIFGASEGDRSAET